MIIPTHCQSCGKRIGHLWDQYVQDVKDRRAQTDIPTTGEPTELKDMDTEPSPEAKALDSLGFTRICCRIMFLCNQDLSDVIS